MDIVNYIQNTELLEEHFFFINKGLIDLILEKLDEGFFPSDISMDNEGYVKVANRIAEENDFTKEQLDWYYETSSKFIGGVGAPFALVGCINRLKKEFETK
jgi:hypothetical protein